MNNCKALIVGKRNIASQILFSLSNIENVLNQGKATFFTSEVFECIDDYDIFIVDESYLNKLDKNILRQVNSKNKRLLIHNNGVYCDPSNKASIAKLEKQLLDNRQWHAVKLLNELKIQLNYLNEEYCLDTYPTTIQLEMTDYCNAECIMCSHFYQRNIGATHLSKQTFDLVKKLLPYAKLGILHGNGEPFLNPNIFDYLETYCEYGVTISTVTNLSVFNDKIAHYINNCISDIRVSCDGCTKEIYEEIRKNLSFDRFVQNLEGFNSKCHSIRKSMAVVIMQQNIHQICDLVRFAKKYRFEEIIFSNMKSSVVLKNDEFEPLHFKAEVKYQLENAKAIANEIGIKIVYPDVYDTVTEVSDKIIDPVFRTQEESEHLRKSVKDIYKLDRVEVENLEDCNWEIDKIKCRGICDWCLEKTYIDIKGNVSVCCINPCYSIGNVNEKSFKEIWNCDEMIKIRRSFCSGILPDFCQKCHFILNNSLNKLEYVEKNEAFFNRRCISKIYSEISSDL